MAEIQAMTIDQYALAEADGQIECFNLVDRVLSEAEETVLLRYEDLVSNFDLFSRELRSMITFSDETMRELYQASRPRQVEEESAHKRSGRIGGFRDHLKPATIAELNTVLQPTLQKYGYLDS